MKSVLPDAQLRVILHSLAPGLSDAAGAAKLDRRIRLQPARRAGLGDLCTAAALAGAGVAGVRIPDFASSLAERLGGLAAVQEAWVGGEGWVNLTLADAALDSVLPHWLAEPKRPVGPVTLPLAAMRRRDPDFAVQYAHARCHSVLRAAAASGPLAAMELAASVRGRLNGAPERRLLCLIDHWARLVEAQPSDLESGAIQLLLNDLTEAFDRLWMQSRGHATVGLLQDDQPDRTRARLALVLGVAGVIQAGLAALGIKAAEEIR